MAIFKKVLKQKKNSKNIIYSLHQLYISCNAKGKEGKKFEFGNKSSIVKTSKSGNGFGPEPVIGHLKQDHRWNRNFLKDAMGNKVNTLLTAPGFNLRKIL